MVNYKPNVGSFERGQIAWNKGLRTNLDLEEINRLHWEEERPLKELAVIYKVSDRLLSLRLKEEGYKVRSFKQTDKTKKKIAETTKKNGRFPPSRKGMDPWNKGKKGVQVAWNKGRDDLPESNKKDKTYEEIYGKDRAKKYKAIIKEKRKTQVTPVKDTTIEIKLQELLTELKVKFYTHRYMGEIEHGYQCDIQIPMQRGIECKTILEADGNYWHKYPLGREIDIQRTQELQAKGWRVLRFWGSEIRLMNVEDLKAKVFFRYI